MATSRLLAWSRMEGECLHFMTCSSAADTGFRLYQACGILGATVMPHSLYLGSGIVQPRLLEYDIKTGHVVVPLQGRSDSSLSSEKPAYQPSLAAIKYCLKYSIWELALCLSLFALFVNSSILIVAGFLARLWLRPGVMHLSSISMTCCPLPSLPQLAPSLPSPFSYLVSQLVSSAQLLVKWSAKER